MATQIVEISGEEARLLRSYQKAVDAQLEYERRLRDGGQTGDAAGIQVEEALAKVKRASDKALRGYLSDLNKLGPEGSAASAALREHLTSAGKAGFQSMDKILAKIREIDPEAAGAAEQARVAFEEAANSTENQFREVLAELNKMGPEGREAADQIKKELVEAGKISERSMHDVVDELEKLDPAAAKAARGVVRNIESAAQRGEKAFESFGLRAAGQIASIAGAYIGVNEAIEKVNAFLEKQIELLIRAKDTQLSLAIAQQQASKNLAGLQVVERNELLQQAAPEIAARAGFPDVAEITQALGAVASAGESDPEKIANAVLQAARLERLTPDELDTTAAAGSAVQRQAGLEDIRQALALVETTGTQARIVDPAALARSLPQAVGSAVATVADQDREEASRQAAALFAQITQGANDEVGRSSATFATDLTARLQKFFVDLSDEQVEARSRIELIDRKIEKGKDTESDRLNRSRLEEFLAASEGVQDPGELFARLQVLQGSDALRRQFVGDGFGEKRFQTVLTDLLNADSERNRELQKSFEAIQANAQFFEGEADQLVRGTPEIALAAADARSEAIRVRREVQDKEGAALAQVREIVSDALTDTAQGLLELNLNFTGRGSLKGSTAAEEALDGVLRLNTRIRQLEQGGVTRKEEADILRLQSEIENLFEFIGALAQEGVLDPDGIARARQRAVGRAEGGFSASGFPLSGAPPTDAQFDRSPQAIALFERMADTLDDIADSNAATAENTGVPAEEPDVTPSLSVQQP